MNTTHSDPDSRGAPPPQEMSVEAVAIDLGHLTGEELEVALATAAWVISLCEGRPRRTRSVRAVRFDLGGDDRPAPSSGHS